MMYVEALNKINVKNVVNAVTVFSPKGRCEKMKDRIWYGISFCTEGQITYIQNGIEYVSNKDCAIILPKGGTYFIKRDKTGSFPVINFDCLDLLCDTLTVIPIQNAEQLIAEYKRLEKLFLFDGSRAQIFSIFYGILHELASDNIPWQLRGAMQLIRSNYRDTSLSNKDLAAECHMSEVYFRKLFKKHFGCSPKQYIIGIRMQKAKQLLSEGGLSVAAISEKCGFSNTYHFCRLFKQHAGVSPSVYRKENQIYEI